MSQRRLGTRLLIGTLLVATVIGITLVDARGSGVRLAMFVSAAAGIAALVEFLRMTGRLTTPWVRRTSVLGGAAVVLWRPVAELLGRDPEASVALGLVLGIAVALPLVVTVLRRRRDPVAAEDLTAVAVGVLGILVVALPMAFLNEIACLGSTTGLAWDRTWSIAGLSGHATGPGIGSWLLIIFVLTSKLNDMGGYLVGGAIGRIRLAPGVSPNKSVEGSLAGVILATGASLLAFGSFGPTRGLLTPTAAAVFGIVVSITTQLGDLAESMIKRSVGVKDSAAILPAFGGMFDLMDSFILSAPAGYTLLLFTMR